jgi:hypothetical protein
VGTSLGWMELQVRTGLGGAAGGDCVELDCRLGLGWVELRMGTGLG